MRPELDLIETIEQYINGQMTEAERSAFEKQLASDPSLREQVDLQRQLMKGIERAGLKEKVQLARNRYYRGKNFTKWGFGGLAVIVILVAAFIYYNSSTQSKQKDTSSIHNEGVASTDAGSNITGQVFDIDVSKDTVIETTAGIVMAIPAGSLLDENGNIAEGRAELTVKEALDPAAIMQAGLSTRSGDELLETGGMFYINAKQNNKPLTIDPAKGIYAEIPSAEIKPGMQLFKGQRTPDGRIDWVDPKPLEHDLVAVNIHTLDLYPNFYLDSLQQWGYDISNKKFTDSLYYSFAWLFAPYAPANTQSDPVVIHESKEELKLNGDSIVPIATDTIAKAPNDLYYMFGDASPCAINPAKIKAIWNDRFQNTLLATREFGERIAWIHMSGDNFVLDLYVNNLDKPMYIIDSMAALRFQNGSPLHQRFADFAARRNGKLKSGSTHFKLLKRYYDNKTKAFTQAITKTHRKFWDEQSRLDRKATDRKNQHEIDSMNRVSQNFSEEFDLNLKEAYRQLGYDTTITPFVNTVAYGVQVTSTGWHNVDKYVYESTANRTTLDYTDPASGKKAVIKYLPFSVSIDDWQNYDRLYVYLVPSKLSSFMRIGGKDGKFEEKLDELMSYQLVCIGYKDEQAYLYKQQTVEPKDYSQIQLTTVEKRDLEQQLKSVGSFNLSSSISKELDYFLFDIKDQKRQKYKFALLQLQRKVAELIFPCMEQTTINVHRPSIRAN